MPKPSTAIRPAPAVRAGAGMRLLRTAVFTAVCVLLAAAGHSIASGRTVPVGSLVCGWLAVFAVVVPLAGRERRLPGITALLAVGELALHAVFSTGQMCSAVPVSASSRPGGTDSLVAVAARLVCGSRAAATLTPEAARRLVVRAGIDPAALRGAGHPAGSAAGMVMSGGSATGHASSASLPCTLLSMLSPAMLLGHLLAALVAGLLLWRGEAALWRLVHLSVRGAAGLTALAMSALRRACALLAALAAGSTGGPRPIRGGARSTAARHRTVWLRHCVARRGPPVVVLAA